MLPALTCALVRQIDRDAMASLGLPSLLLMENAARGVCQVITRDNCWNSITILAGPGNNGGDGLAVARLLAAQGIAATALLITGGKQLSADAAENRRFLNNCGILVTEPTREEIVRILETRTSRDLVVDALLGTGIRGNVASPFSEVIQLVNASKASILAVDVPSGLDCDSGLPCGISICAQTTVTFVASKVGFLNESARKYTGFVEVCQIGIPQDWLSRWHAAQSRGVAT
jgi:NAD(P)H-hydrate epimerase